MIVITSDGKIAKADGRLTGHFIGVFAEPNDRIGELSDVVRGFIWPQFVPSPSLKEMLSATNLLKKHLLHRWRQQPEQRCAVCQAEKRPA